MFDVPAYEGSSGFLRWWPKLLIAAALFLLVIGRDRTSQWATLFVVIAYVHAKCFPWRFAVLDEGLLLTFAFGRRRFLPKSSTTVRMETVGAIARGPRYRHFGYLLLDGVLYRPGRGLRLRAAFDACGYTVA
jgi:hypothetical protein